jgi:hypothetical protein
MVQPPFVRTGKELALHRRRAIKGHAAREAKRTENAVREAKRTESLKRRASLPQNRTFECEDPADFCAQLLKDALNAVKDALVVVERVIQKNTPQDKPAVEQVFAYPGEASADQPFMQELFANWDAKKIAHSIAEAALGRPAPGSWVRVTSFTAQSRAERSLVGQHSGVWAWMSSDAAKNADGATGSVRDKTQFLPDQKPLLPKKNATLAKTKGEVDGKKGFLGGNNFLVAHVRYCCHLLPGKKGASTMAFVATAPTKATEVPQVYFTGAVALVMGALDPAVVNALGSRTIAGDQHTTSSSTRFTSMPSSSVLQ